MTKQHLLQAATTALLSLFVCAMVSSCVTLDKAPESRTDKIPAPSTAPDTSAEPKTHDRDDNKAGRKKNSNLVYGNVQIIHIYTDESYNWKQEDIWENVVITIQDTVTLKEHKAKTNDFGEFLFTDLNEGRYSLSLITENSRKIVVKPRFAFQLTVNNGQVTNMGRIIVTYDETEGTSDLETGFDYHRIKGNFSELHPQSPWLNVVWTEAGD